MPIRRATYHQASLIQSKIKVKLFWVTLGLQYVPHSSHICESAVTDLRQESGRSHGLHPPELGDGRRAEVEVRRGDVFLVGIVLVIVLRENFFGASFVEVFPAYSVNLKVVLTWILDGGPTGLRPKMPFSEQNKSVVLPSRS